MYRGALWKPEDNLMEWLLSFYDVGPRDQTHVVRFGASAFGHGFISQASGGSNLSSHFSEEESTLRNLSLRNLATSGDGVRAQVRVCAWYHRKMA